MLAEDILQLLDGVGNRPAVSGMCGGLRPLKEKLIKKLLWPIQQQS